MSVVQRRWVNFYVSAGFALMVFDSFENFYALGKLRRSVPQFSTFFDLENQECMGTFLFVNRF